MNVQRLAVIGVLWLLCLGVPAPVSAAERAARPNVVLILVDDFGYECVAANGGRSYQTPQLDKLAATGARFTNCYAQPLCTPTRVQLMTGIYNVRNYTTFGEIDPQATTFAHLLKENGYATGIAGKWQLGRQLDLPKKLGFDEHCLWQHMRRPSRYKNPGLEIDGKQVDYTNGEYGPDIVNDWALSFIERHRAEPFFLYYPMMLTHSPYEPTPDGPNYLRRREGKEDEEKPGRQGQRRFAGMVRYCDKLVGKLMDRLDAMKLRENTLVIVVGDNGTGKGIQSQLGETTVEGGKGKLTRAGMHVPLIVHWPAAIKPSVHDGLVYTTDFLPTICAATGTEVPAKLAIDGQSFLPLLLGEKTRVRDWYYCWYAPRGKFVGEFAATADYKLYRDGRLIDLRRDPEEKSPLHVEALPAGADAAKKLLGEALAKYADSRR